MAKRLQLSRRLFLGGAATMVGLPFLEAMTPWNRAHAQPVAPRRFMAVYMPNGVIMDAWTPTTTGAGYTLSPILQPLEAVKSKVLVISGTENKPGSVNTDLDIGHHTPTSCFLTHTTPRQAPRTNGMSADQVAAQSLKQFTKLPSLELGTPDNGWNAFMRNISWGENATPMQKEVKPQLVFDRLFAGYSPDASTAEANRRRALRKSVLDQVLGQSSKLQGQLGRQDQQKLDEYFTGVRELERRINLEAMNACAPGTAPGNVTNTFLVLPLMYDLIVQAFRCDATRVATLMFDRAGSDIGYPHLGIAESHHVLSHEVHNPAVKAQLQTINRWHMQHFADFLGKLDAIAEGEGTVLDNSAIAYSSELSDGELHNKVNLPVLLAGRGGGTINSGRHLKFAAGTPRSNVYLSMLKTVGSPATTFGQDGTAPLDGVLV